MLINIVLVNVITTFRNNFASDVWVGKEGLKVSYCGLSRIQNLQFGNLHDEKLYDIQKCPDFWFSYKNQVVLPQRMCVPSNH